MIIPIRNRCSFKITALVFIFFVESGSPASALRDSMGVRGGRGDWESKDKDVNIPAGLWDPSADNNCRNSKMACLWYNIGFGGLLDMRREKNAGQRNLIQ